MRRTPAQTTRTHPTQYPAWAFRLGNGGDDESWGGGTTEPSTGQVVWLKASGAINATGWATTDSTGLGTITISTSGVVHGEVILTAFYDPRDSGIFDQYQVAWAKGAFPIGTVVDVVAAPDVAVAPVMTGIGNYSGGWFGMSGYKGEADGGTRAIKADQNSWWYPGVPSSSQNEGWYVTKNKGLCISPNKTYVGGYSYAWRLDGVYHIEKRPVGWNGATFIDLGAEDFANDTEGQALAVNDQGEFVGERVLPDELGLPKYYRAFRTRPGGQSIAAQDLLPPPPQAGYDDAEIPVVARAIGPGTATLSGIALGEASLDPLSPDSRTLPARWLPRAKVAGSWEPNSAASFGAVRDDLGVRHGSWLAASPADGSGEYFGWDLASGESQTSAAWWRTAFGSSVRLNDAFAVMGFGTGSVWQLTSVVDANDSRRLLVVGAKNASERAVLLVPQSVQP